MRLVIHHLTIGEQQGQHNIEQLVFCEVLQNVYGNSLRGPTAVGVAHSSHNFSLHQRK